ncbi:MAG: transglutaminase domain-containing protein [Sphingomonadaceae bacterium]
MRLSIHHTTHYRYSDPVSHGLQRLRMRPKSTHNQQVLDWDMVLGGSRIEVEYEDHHFNSTVLVNVDPGATELTVECRGLVDTSDAAGIIGSHSGHLPLWSFLRTTRLTRAGSHMRKLVASLDTQSQSTLETLHQLSTAIQESVRYEIGHTNVETTAEQALEAGHGVCQDHAHIFIGAARMLDIPARYVSGYLMMNDRIDQEAGHAWTEAHVDGLGWVGFDISNGISPDERYVRVATGFDYRDAAPVAGVSYGAGESELHVTLAVEQQIAEQ